MWIGSLGPRMFWGTRATNFSIYTTKMEGAGPKILVTGAKFKQVPCQKNCRVNRALVLVCFLVPVENGKSAREGTNTSTRQQVLRAFTSWFYNSIALINYYLIV